MKSLITPAPKTPAVNPYPCIKVLNNGIHNNLYCLFSSHNCATVVSSEKGSPYKIGHYAEGWSASSFSEFDGEITLSN